MSEVDEEIKGVDSRDGEAGRKERSVIFSVVTTNELSPPP